MTQIKVICPECGLPMVLRQTKIYKYSNGKPRKFWGCSQFPNCKASHGAHPNGMPMGFPANKETKQLRIVTHFLLEIFQKEFGYSTNELYRRIAIMLGVSEVQAHIGKLTKEQCQELILNLYCKLITKI